MARDTNPTIPLIDPSNFKPYPQAMGHHNVGGVTHTSFSGIPNRGSAMEKVMTAFPAAQIIPRELHGEVPDFSVLIPEHLTEWPKSLQKLWKSSPSSSAEVG